MKKLKAFLLRGTDKKDKYKDDDAPYFQQAANWADDIYTRMMVSRHRYQLAFMVSMGLAAILTISLCITAMNQQIKLVVVHRNPSGFTYVTLDSPQHAPKATRQEVESDIVRYLTARESYHPATYQIQSSLTSLLSNNRVDAEYSLSQSKDHPEAPVHFFKNKGYRKVNVQSILFLDNDAENEPDNKPTHKNLVQVNFEVSDYLFGQDQHIDTPYTALMSWEYRGAPSDPEKAWQNWSGFLVTSYQVQAVSVHKV